MFNDFLLFVNLSFALFPIGGLKDDMNKLHALKHGDSTVITSGRSRCRFFPTIKSNCQV